jgi:hypothetical protein
MANQRSDDRKVAAAMQAATMASIQVLVRCLETNGGLRRGEYPEALLLYMEAAKDNPGIMLALLHELRMSLLD